MVLEVYPFFKIPDIGLFCRALLFDNFISSMPPAAGEVRDDL